MSKWQDYVLDNWVQTVKPNIEVRINPEVSGPMLCPTHGPVAPFSLDGAPVCPRCKSGLDEGRTKIRGRQIPLWIVVLYGPLHVKCWVSHDSHLPNIAVDIASAKAWSLDGHAGLFDGEVKPRHIKLWYREHGRISNHPGWVQYVHKPESEPLYKAARDRTQARFQCPHCGHRPVRKLIGVEFRDTICTSPKCLKIWKAP